MPVATTTGPETFRRAWRGYDRTQVDAFVQQAAADRVRLREALARVDALVAQYARSGPYVIVAAAERQAQEIRVTAEAEANRLLQEAKAQAETLRRGHPKPTTRAPGSDRARVARHTRLVVSAVSVVLVVCGAIALARPAIISELPSSSDSVAMPKPPELFLIPRPSVPPLPSLPSERPQSVELTLTAQRRCWISAVVDDKQSLERLLRRGETIVLTARREAVLRIGDAGAVTLLLNGQRTQPLGVPGEVVNPRITPSNYMSFLARNLQSPRLSPSEVGTRAQN